MTGFGPLVSGYTAATNENESWGDVKKNCLEGATKPGWGYAGLASCGRLCREASSANQCSKYCDYCALGYGNPQPYGPRGIDVPPGGLQLPMVTCNNGGNNGGKKRGVGYPGIPEGYSNLFEEKGQISATRGGPWKGFCAELQPMTNIGLRNAWVGNAWGTKDQYDGYPTWAEMDWVCVNVATHSDFFRTWLFAKAQGGTQDNPMMISASNTFGLENTYHLRAGLNSYSNPEYNTPFWVNFQGTQAEADALNTASDNHQKQGCAANDAVSCYNLCKKGYSEYCRH
jgi:hypothetical protein